MSDFMAQPPPMPSPAANLEDIVPSRRHFFREQRTTIVVAAVVAALVGAVTAAGISAVVSLSRRAGGIMGLQSSGAALTQEGNAIIRSEPVEVYYPVPYGSPPNLSLTGGPSMNCVLVEQKQDHFKAKLAPPWTNPVSITWTAQGRPGPGH
jgi:hypothetical protein